MLRSRFVPAAGIAAALLAFASGLRAQEAAALLPSGARAIVSVRDGAAFWDRLRATRMYEALSASPRVRERLAGKLPISEAAWRTIAGRDAAIGIYGRGGGDDDADLALVARVPDPALARTAMAVLAAGEDRDIAWEIRGEWLAAASTPGRLATALDRMSGGGSDPGMGAHAGWTGAARRHADASVLVWADVEALREQMPDAARGSPLARSIDLGVRWVEQGLRGDARIDLSPDAPPALAALGAAPAAELTTLTTLPASSLLVLAAAGWQPGILLGGSAADSAARARVDSFAARSGIDVDREIEAAFGRQAALAVVGLQRTFLPFPVPTIAAAIEVQDEARARAVMEKIERWSAAELLRRRSIPLAWQDESYGGVRLRYAPGPFGETIEAAYAVTPSVAILGSSRAAVRALLDAGAGRASSMSRSPDLSAVRELLPQRTTVLFVLDLAGLAAAVEEAAGAFGWLEGAESDSAAIRAALESIPRLTIAAQPEPDGGLRAQGLLEIR